MRSVGSAIGLGAGGRISAFIPDKHNGMALINRAIIT